MLHTFFFSPSDTTRKYTKGIMYAAADKIFCSQNSKRREPELFL